MTYQVPRAQDRANLSQVLILSEVVGTLLLLGLLALPAAHPELFAHVPLGVSVPPMGRAPQEQRLGVAFHPCIPDARHKA